jgi:hypothetical protein
MRKKYNLRNFFAGFRKKCGDQLTENPTKIVINKLNFNSLSK